MRQNQNKRQAVYNLTALVYKWLSKGFDTADHQEAKWLLVELEG